MNAFDEIKNIRGWLADLNRRLMEIRRTGGSDGGGEANTGSNVGSAGVGIFDAKVGVDLQFRKANPKSNKVLITLDSPNKKVDFDIDPSKVNLDDLGDVNAGSPADGQVLTWDGAATEWQAKAAAGGAGGAGLEAYRKSGRYYSCDIRTYSLTTTWLTYNYIYAIPFIVAAQQAFDRIGINCNSGVSNAVGRLGLYEDDGTPYPGNLIHGTSELDFSASGDKEETISETLDPGLYWLAILIGGANPSVRALYYQYHTFPILGRSSLSDLIPYNSLKGSQTYGSMPDPFPSGIAEQDSQNPPAVMLRVA